MATTPEGKIKSRLDKVFKKHKIWYFSPQSGPFGRSGIPDRLAIVKGRIVGVEAKADRTKKPTALQDKCMREIEAAGGKCFLVFDNDTIKEVEDYIISAKEVQW